MENVKKILGMTVESGTVEWMTMEWTTVDIGLINHAYSCIKKFWAKRIRKTQAYHSAFGKFLRNG